MTPHAAETHPDYSSALTVFGWEASEELGQLVEIVKFLRRRIASPKTLPKASGCLK